MTQETGMTAPADPIAAIREWAEAQDAYTALSERAKYAEISMRFQRIESAETSLRAILAAHDAQSIPAAGKFRKRPVVIEAVQLRQRFPWPIWFHDAVTENKIVTHGLGKFADGPVFCEIATLEGTMRADDGDWIIRGVKGEIYPCKPDIFAATYEPAEADAQSGETVEVRIAVGIKSSGDWLAHARGRDPGFNAAYASDMVDEGFTVYFVTARVPLPQEIKGRVEHG